MVAPHTVIGYLSDRGINLDVADPNDADEVLASIDQLLKSLENETADSTDPRRYHLVSARDMLKRTEQAGDLVPVVAQIELMQQQLSQLQRAGDDAAKAQEEARSATADRAYLDRYHDVQDNQRSTRRRKTGLGGGFSAAMATATAAADEVSEIVAPWLPPSVVASGTAVAAILGGLATVRSWLVGQLEALEIELLNSAHSQSVALQAVHWSATRRQTIADELYESIEEVEAAGFRPNVELDKLENFIEQYSPPRKQLTDQYPGRALFTTSDYATELEVHLRGLSPAYAEPPGILRRASLVLRRRYGSRYHRRHNLAVMVRSDHRAPRELHEIAQAALNRMVGHGWIGDVRESAFYPLEHYFISDETLAEISHREPTDELGPDGWHFRDPIE